LWPRVIRGRRRLAAGPGPFGTVGDLAVVATPYGIALELRLAFFNLLRLPPLDGSHVLYHLLPERARPRYRELGRYGLLVLMGLLFVVPGVFRYLLWPVFFFQNLANRFIELWI